MFIDKIKIYVKAGAGGNGAVSFRREKYVAQGGPDGGDGGNGGSIILKVDDHMSTLMDFRYKRKYTATPGQDGMGGRKTGKDGAGRRIVKQMADMLSVTEEELRDLAASVDSVLSQGYICTIGNEEKILENKDLFENIVRLN